MEEAVLWEGPRKHIPLCWHTAFLPVVLQAKIELDRHHIAKTDWLYGHVTITLQKGYLANKVVLRVADCQENVRLPRGRGTGESFGFLLHTDWRTFGSTLGTKVNGIAD